MKINTQLLLSQSLLIILSLLIVVLNIFTFYNIRSDANFINYAGKLRVLNYKMVHISHEIAMGIDNASNAKEELLETIGKYETIIDKLIEGDPDSKLKKLQHKSTLKSILEFREVWYGKHKNYYEKILENGDRDAFSEINLELADHVNKIDNMVTNYSEFSEEKVSEAIWRNGLTVIIIIIVSCYSYVSVNNKIKKPMNKLLKELDDMDLIDNELAKKINLSKKDEFATMSSYIDELIYDGLTRTYNRRTGLSRLATILENGKEDLHFSLIFMDLNGLKEVNDNLGHEAGDELLNLAVDSVKEIIRDNDFIIRLGGDEFLVALKDVNEKTAGEIWARVLQKYEDINSSMEKPYIISVSHGVIEYNKNSGITLEDLIKIADEKMYAEKRRIKNNPEYKIIRG